MRLPTLDILKIKEWDKKDKSRWEDVLAALIKTTATLAVLHLYSLPENHVRQALIANEVHNLRSFGLALFCSSFGVYGRQQFHSNLKRLYDLPKHLNFLTDLDVDMHDPNCRTCLRSLVGWAAEVHCLRNLHIVGEICVDCKSYDHEAATQRMAAIFTRDLVIPLRDRKTNGNHLAWLERITRGATEKQIQLRREERARRRKLPLEKVTCEVIFKCQEYIDHESGCKMTKTSICYYALAFSSEGTVPTPKIRTRVEVADEFSMLADWL